MTKVLEGKKGLVVGIANDHSIAWGIAKCLHEEGASMYLTYQNDSIKKRVEPLSQKINCLGIMPCDVSDTTSLESVRDGICLLYTSPSPRDKRQSRMPSSA